MGVKKSICMIVASALVLAILLGPSGCSDSDGTWNEPQDTDETLSSYIFSQIFGGFLSGIGGWSDSQALGWVVNMLRNQSNPDTEILDKLDAMESQLNQIIDDLETIMTEIHDLAIELALDIDEIKTYLDGMGAKDAITVIKTHYDQNDQDSLTYFANISNPNNMTDDEKAALQAFANNVRVAWDIESKVTAIYDAIVPSLGEGGVLEDWTSEFIIENSLANGDNLLDYYKTLEKYFGYLLYWQMKGVALYVEAINYQSTDPDSHYSKQADDYLNKTIRPFLQQEVDEFLSCVEELVLSKADMQQGSSDFLPSSAEEIFARADFFAAQVLTNSHVVTGSSDNFGLRGRIIATRDVLEKEETMFAEDLIPNYEWSCIDKGTECCKDSDCNDNICDRTGPKYDKWDDKNVTPSSTYTVVRYSFTQNERGLGPYPGKYGIYKSSNDDQVASVLAKTYNAKDFTEDPDGKIIYGNFLIAWRGGGNAFFMAPLSWIQQEEVEHHHYWCEYDWIHDLSSTPKELGIKTHSHEVDGSIGWPAFTGFNKMYRNFTFKGDKDTAITVHYSYDVASKIWLGLQGGESQVFCSTATINRTIRVYDLTEGGDTIVVQAGKWEETGGDCPSTTYYSHAEHEGSLSFTAKPGHTYTLSVQVYEKAATTTAGAPSGFTADTVLKWNQSRLTFP